MSFINKKEEVINIVLTRHGKRSVMKGNFDPIYYRFFDDGVIYDSNWAGFAEKQNESEERIKEAPVMKPQSSHVGVETSFENHYDDLDISNNSIDKFYQPLEQIQDEEEEAKCLKHPLFSSRLGSQNTSQFTIQSLNQPFEGSLSYREKYGENIPVSNVRFASTSVVQSILNPEESVELEVVDNETLIDESMSFSDGTFFRTDQDYLVFSAKETNVLSEGGFEIEIFEEVSGSLVKYYFDHPDRLRVVEDYFEIIIGDDAEDLVDAENVRIPPSIFTTLGDIVPSRVLTQQDTLRQGNVHNLYTGLPSDEDVEDCE